MGDEGEDVVCYCSEQYSSVANVCFVWKGGE